MLLRHFKWSKASGAMSRTVQQWFIYFPVCSVSQSGISNSTSLPTGCLTVSWLEVRVVLIRHSLVILDFYDPWVPDYGLGWLVKCKEAWNIKWFLFSNNFTSFQSHWLPGMRQNQAEVENNLNSIARSLLSLTNVKTWNILIRFCTNVGTCDCIVIVSDYYLRYFTQNISICGQNIIALICPI